MENKAEIRKTRELLNHLVSPQAPTMAPRKVKVIANTNSPTYLDSVIASMIVEVVENGNVNAAKLLLGLYSDRQS